MAGLRMAGRVMVSLVLCTSTWLVWSAAPDTKPVRPDHPTPLQLLNHREAAAAAAAVQTRWVKPRQFKMARLNEVGLQRLLAQAPDEWAGVSRTSSPLVINLPTPDGGQEAFVIWNSPIMEPELAQWLADQGYPMATFKGQSLVDPTTTVRLDFGGPAGFHARVLGQAKAFQIDPFEQGNRTLYAVYHDKHYPAPRNGFVCEFENEHVALSAQKQNANESSESNDTAPDLGDSLPIIMPSGDVNELRTYRLANAATGEYTAFHGGTQVAGQAAVVTAINRVNMVYERDLSIRMILVGNNQDVVYTNSVTDPFTNSSGPAMLTENTNTLSTEIGNANFDIGHVFSTGGGGVAGLGVVCSSGKARGVTGQGSPTGDPFWIDYVAHEMGHQWGGNHPFDGINGACTGGNRNDSTAYETGSGSSIQAYAGICGADNIQSNSDDFFLAISLDEILAFSNGVTCDVTLVSGNANRPTVSAGNDYDIPVSTPFELTALNGADLDGDTLTYSWEQFDLSVGATGDALANGDMSDNPIVRSWPPTTDPVRMIPNQTSLLNNTFVAGEILPTTSRSMTFRSIVRDNNAGGGLVNTDRMSVFVDIGSGPFLVTFPNGGESLAGPATVTWDVAGTGGAPVSATNVDILLSTDSGMTFPTTLLTMTSNDGTQGVLLPNINTTTARIKVRGSGNIFFDVSNADFTIAPGCTPPDPPTNVQVGVPGANQLQVTWDAVSGATGYTIYRFQGACPGGPFTEVGNVSAPITSFTDSTVSGGVTYAYYVTTTDACFNSDSSLCADGTATGGCALPPTFAGLTSVSNPGNSNCTLNLAWSPATAHCGGPASYDIFRSTSQGFPPGGANLLVSGVSGTTYMDVASLNDGTAYYYVVRATDETNAQQETNSVEQTSAPTGTIVSGSFSENFEGATGFTSSGLWHTVNDSACIDPNSTQTFYFGQDSPTCDYDTGATATGDLTSPNIPNITATSQLSFDFLLGTEQFGSGYDNALVQVRENGGAFVNIDQDASNSGTLADGGGGALAAKSYSLAAYDGSDIEVRFRFGTVDNVSNAFLGWFVDNFLVTNTGIAGTCTTVSGNTPQEVAPSGGLGAVMGTGTEVDLTYTPACGTTDNTVFFGTGVNNLGGGPDFTGNVCGLGNTGALNFDPGTPSSGQFFYFILSGNDSSAEGSYGQTSAGVERSEVDGLTCDFVLTTGGSCI